MEPASPSRTLEELRASLARSEQARLAAEARAVALQAGQAQSARELASLQSLFRQAVEENRGLLEQLAACQARATALEAAAALAAPAPPRCAEPPPLPLGQPHQQQQERYPAIYARPAVRHGVDHNAPAQQACPHVGVPPSTTDQLSRVKRALADQLGDPPPLAQQARPLPQPHYQSISLLASAGPGGPLVDQPAQQRQRQQQQQQQQQQQDTDAVCSSQPKPAQAPPPPAGDLHRVFSELQALQRRLQAAEERLQLQAGSGTQGGHAKQQLQQRQQQQLSSGDSRPASPRITAQPAPSPAKHRGQEHRDSYQLIRELKQRRARLEAERLAVAAAALAAGAQLQGPGAPCPPSAGPRASGAREAPWLFDTRDLPPGAALHQPLPRQAASGRAAGSTGSWAQQPAGHGWGARGRAGGSRSSGTSPMAWHAARQQLPGTVGGSSRGRRRSLSVEPRRSASRDEREPLQLSSRRRSSSRSRSEREELDRLLMAGQPTTLLASAGKGAAGGAAGLSSRGQRSTAGRASGGAWVSPCVLA